MITKTISSLALAAALSFGGAAAAQPQVRIDTNAYALGTPEGQHQLDRALRRAATTVCDVDYSVEPLEVRMLQRDCVAKALSSAHQQLAVIMDNVSGKNTMLALSTPRDIVSPKH